MFEQIINEKAAEILKSITLKDEGVKLNELMSSNSLDEFDKKYFEAEVYWRIYVDYLDRKSNHHFDYTDFENSVHFNELRDYQKSFAVFSKDDLNEIAFLISKIKLNYLIRPQNTLNWFVFRNEPTKIFKEMFMRLNYFFEYKYLIDFLFHYFKEKQIDIESKEIITSAEFQKLISKIDKEFLETIDFADFVFLCEPIFNYFGGNVCPIYALIIFLDDKGLKKTAYLLEKYSFDNNIDSISKEQFEAFLTNNQSIVSSNLDSENYIIPTESVNSYNNMHETLENVLSSVVDVDFSNDDESELEEMLIQSEEAEFVDDILEENSYSLENSISDIANENDTQTYYNMEELSGLSFDELIEKLNSKVVINSKTSDFLPLKEFEKQINDLSYTEDNFKNELIDFYKSL